MMSISALRFSGFRTSSPNGNKHSIAALYSMAELYFTNSSFNVVLESNVTIALLWDLRLSLKKL